MFKIFSTVKRVAAAVTGNIDEQIYKDVYSAQELLLSEAERILNEPFEYDEERINRLRRLHELGFANAEEIIEYNSIQSRRMQQAALKEKIDYYQQTYPLSKFINEESVKAICEKYGLLLTVVRDYTGEIPVKCQDQIINFSVIRRDVREPREIYLGSWFSEFPRYRSLDDYKAKKAKENERTSGQHLMILAPPHKLDLRGKEKKGHILQIKDPVVLQPVHEGYLIVSSWGFEAADPLVMNPHSN